MYKHFIKPMADIILALIATIVLFVPILIISLAIYIDDPGSVLFKQKRVGKKKNGQITYFYLHKFRSMKMSTPHDNPTHLLDNPESYITKVGKWCRKLSIDELAQIPFDILTGVRGIICSCHNMLVS